jgi:hypothetical protein
MAAQRHPDNPTPSNGAPTMKPFHLESFATGRRQTVYAPTWEAALNATPGEHFTILATADGRFMAGSNQNSVFSVAPGHYADTPEAAAASLKGHYALIVATRESQDAATTKH